MAVMSLTTVLVVRRPKSRLRALWVLRRYQKTLSKTSVDGIRRTRADPILSPPSPLERAVQVNWVANSESQVRPLSQSALTSIHRSRRLWRTKPRLRRQNKRHRRMALQNHQGMAKNRDLLREAPHLLMHQINEHQMRRDKPVFHTSHIRILAIISQTAAACHLTSSGIPTISWHAIEASSEEITSSQRREILREIGTSTRATGTNS